MPAYFFQTISTCAAFADEPYLQEEGQVVFSL